MEDLNNIACGSSEIDTDSHETSVANIDLTPFNVNIEKQEVDSVSGNKLNNLT